METRPSIIKAAAAVCWLLMSSGLAFGQGVDRHEPYYEEYAEDVCPGRGSTRGRSWRVNAYGWRG